MNEVKPFVVWLDPGLTTGGASYDLQDSTFTSWQSGPDDLVQHLQELEKTCAGRMQIGWEMYLAAGGPQHGTSKHSQEAIGRVRAFALAYGVEVLKPHTSSARKLGSTVFLRRLGWYKPGSPHANDAAMHTLSHLMMMRPMPSAIRESLFPGYAPGVTIAP